MAKVNESDFIYAEISPKWIENFKDDIEGKVKDVDFHKILLFFVIFTPTNNTSAMSKKLEEDYGWRNTYKLKKAMRLAPPKESIFAFAEKLEEMKGVLADADLADNFTSNFEHERCGLYQGNKSQLDCVFSHLRNCLAHGRFSIREKDGDRTFIFEDFGKKSRVSARMILKKSTLLRWIEIIEGGEASLAST